MVALAKSFKRPIIGEISVRVDEQYRQCVAALYFDKEDETCNVLRRMPAGTAFFVGVPLSETDPRPLVYLVTVRHVIDGTRPYESLYVRVNLKDGKYEDIHAPHGAWLLNPTTDVAVARFTGSAKYDMKHIPLAHFITDEMVNTQQIYMRHYFGAGDEVFFTGLFAEFGGRERYQPIVRHGNIALMPYEDIAVRMHPGSDTRTRIRAYLVEARSWSGHSGSPAFVLPGRTLPHKLLGIVQGHFEVEKDIKFLGDIGSGTVALNTGIAVVVPAQAIIDTLMTDEFVQEREELIRLLAEQS